MVGCFTADAVVVNPRGEVATGRIELVRIFSEFLRGPALGSRHITRIDGLRFVTPDVAVVDGEATLSWAAGVGRAPAPLVHRFTDILVRRTLGWRVSQVRAYVWMEQ